MDVAVAPVHTLPAELTIYTVGELHAQWLAWLDSDDVAPAAGAADDVLVDDGGDAVFVLDGSGVEQADAAGVQLLLSLAAALKQRGRRLQLQQAAAPLTEACAALGLADWLTRLDPATLEAV